MTVSAIVALWLSEPEVPFTVTVTFPSVAVAEAVNVRVEVTLPLAAGVTGLEENAAVTPVGKPVALRVVAELKLSSTGYFDRAGAFATPFHAKRSRRGANRKVWRRSSAHREGKGSGRDQAAARYR